MLSLLILGDHVMSVKQPRNGVKEMAVYFLQIFIQAAGDDTPETNKSHSGENE